MKNPKFETRSRDSNSGPHDCEADALPHDHGHHVSTLFQSYQATTFNFMHFLGFHIELSSTFRRFQHYCSHTMATSHIFLHVLGFHWYQVKAVKCLAQGHSREKLGTKGFQKAIPTLYYWPCSNSLFILSRVSVPQSR